MVDVFEIKFKQGKLNTNADALSRIKSSFALIQTQENIFWKGDNIVHCISDDKMLNNGFAKHIDAKFLSKQFWSNGNGNVIAQPIPKNKTLFHLTTKSKYSEKTKPRKKIRLCLNEPKDYCLENDFAELHMSKICSRLDEHNFESIHQTILEIFEKTNITIFIHERVKEINLNDNLSVSVQVDETETVTDQTIYSDDENELNNVLFKESGINVGKNQIIMSLHEKIQK